MNQNQQQYNQQNNQQQSQYKAFGFNPESAKQADSSSRIEEAGKYVGTIRSMEFITARSGTSGFEIDFVADGGESTNLTIYTEKTDGTVLSGTAKINALLACCGVQRLTPTTQQLEKYDHDVKAQVMRPCVIAPEMTGIRIGFLLQRENYTNTSGNARHVMNLYSVFNATSELMAKEILDRKTSPESLPKVLMSLMANPTTQRKPQNGGGFQQNNGYGGQQGGYQQNQNNGFNQNHGGQNSVPQALNNSHDFGAPPAHFGDLEY